MWPALTLRAKDAEHGFDETLGLGARHEHAGIDREVERSKRGTSGDVLHRLSRKAPLDPGVERLNRLRGNRACGFEAQLRARESEQAAHEFQSVGGGDAAQSEALLRRAQRVGGGA